MINYRFFTILIFSCFIIAGCTPKTIKYFLGDADILREQNQSKSRSYCNDPLNYTATEENKYHLPVRMVKVNIHFMNSSDSLNNYSEEEGRQWAKDIIGAGNDMFRKNAPSKLPEGNNNYVFPTRIRYKLVGRPGDPNDDGIYFHYDDECCFSVKTGKHSTLYKKNMFKRYGSMKDTVLNIFFSPIHPDSVASETYRAFMGGVALGNFIKMMIPYDPENKMPPWHVSSTLNHELGHILGLVHAWSYNDGCDDTPRHDLKVRSSNVMDYNSSQRSWTPCQLGKVHRKMSKQRSSSRKFLVRDWCSIDTNKIIRIADSVRWLGAKDLISHIYIENGGVLEIGCRVSLPKNAIISIAPNGKLILGPNARLHNDCGENWKGIEIQKQGKEKGTVVFIGDPKIEDMTNSL